MEHILAADYDKFGVKVNMKSKAHCFLTNIRYLVVYVVAVDLQ